MGRVVRVRESEGQVVTIHPKVWGRVTPGGETHHTTNIPTPHHPTTITSPPRPTYIRGAFFGPGRRSKKGCSTPPKKLISHTLGSEEDIGRKTRTPVLPVSLPVCDIVVQSFGEFSPRIFLTEMIFACFAVVVGGWNKKRGGFRERKRERKRAEEKPKYLDA